MEQRNRSKLKNYLSLLSLHRGETRDAYDAVSAAYDDFASVWDRYVAASALEYYNRSISEYVATGSVVLDVGAGTGERVIALLEHTDAGRIVAIEASRKMLDVARSKIRDRRVTFIQGDGTALPFADDTFDLVSSTWMIETLGNPRAAVREFVRTIKPDGLAIYAFCSLPEGELGEVLEHVVAKLAPKESPLSHLLGKDDRPFHDCMRSSLKQFTGGLTTVATLAKCCPVSEEILPCRSQGSDWHWRTPPGQSGREASLDQKPTLL